MHLKNLSILDVSKNKLKCLPEALGEMKSLTVLNVGHNKALQRLPKSLGYAQQITQLGIDGLRLTYPPEDVQSGGTIVIVAFLANECGIDYSPEDCIPETEAPNNVNSQGADQSVHNKDNEVQV